MGIFNTIPAPKNKRSRFNMNHSVKTALGIGKLVPVLCREILPGDVVNLNTNVLARMAPMLSPLMHDISIRTETFFVPNRLIYEDWQDFITGGNSGNLAPVKPYITGAQLIALGDLRNSNVDYLSVPLNPATGIALVPNTTTERIDLMPFLALELIYNEYYRDPNLEADYNSLFPVPSGNFNETLGLSFRDLLRTKSRCWEKDYFTAALPWTQRGPQAMLPVTGDVTLNNNSNNPMIVRDAVNNSTRPNSRNIGTLSVGAPGTFADGPSATSFDNPDVIDPNGRLNSSSSISINDLRRTSAVQRWLENNARGGSRYIEQILAHFGVISSDSRLQRPEYLGGGRTPIHISEVVQTSGSNINGQSTPQANLAGHGIGGGVNHGCLRRFEEHGFVVMFVSVVPRSSYIFGLEPMFTRRFDKLDYAWPELARLGEQPVYQSELDARSSSSFNTVFGYQPRYSDWKYVLSRSTGEMQRTLSFWNMSRRVNSINPVLSSQFNHIDQALFYQNFSAGAESADQQVYLELHHALRISRKLPKYGVPILT